MLLDFCITFEQTETLEIYMEIFQTVCISPTGDSKLLTITFVCMLFVTIRHD